MTIYRAWRSSLTCNNPVKHITVTTSQALPSKLTSAQFQQVQQLFEQASQLTISEQQTWFSQQPEIDTAVAAKVRQLLRISNQLRDDQEPQAIAVIDVFELALIESELGSYQLIKSLGEGGMGRVYLARRNDQAFDKDVVIKLMKGFHKKGTALQRFHFERQVLARMEHPNIARLLDGGECQDGTPYYVMEHVNGSTVSSYCREHNLSIAARLALFQKICAAVHYAHQNLIIHRDLKPSNILINADAEPKLLDFGIAKQIGADHDALTRATVGPMTPTYCSPEQMLGQNLTTASDIYSLGVILFEILTGEGPYGADNAHPLRQPAAICDYRPKAPSKSASNQNLSKTPWSSDLDNIVLKALRKDPGRRYRSAFQLSEDLQRYLDGLPVSASRNTWVYRCNKLIQRHRWVVSGIALALVILGWQQIRVLEQRDQARLNAVRAEQNQDFVVGMFDILDPSLSDGAEISAKTVLDHGAHQLRNILNTQPESRATLLVTLGGLYQKHGLYDDAAALIESAVTIRRDSFGNQHPMVADALDALAAVYIDHTHYQPALQTIQEALQIRELYRNQQPDGHIRSLNVLSEVYSGTGQLKAARQTAEQSTAIARSSLSTQNPSLLRQTLKLLGVTYADLGEYPLAQQSLRESLSICEQQYAPIHIDCAEIIHSLGVVLSAQGLYEQAEQYYRKSLAVTEKILGNKHPDVAFIQNSLGLLLINTGRFYEAETTLKSSMQLTENQLGHDNINIATQLSNLALLYRETDRLEEALQAAERALKIRQKATPDNLDDIAQRQYVVALTLRRMGRLELAEQIYWQVMNTWVDTRGVNNVNVATVRASLAAVLAHQGKYQLAEAQTRQAMNIYRQNLDPSHWHIAVLQSSLGGIVLRQNRFEEAESLLLPACERLFQAKTMQSDYTRTCTEHVIELLKKTDRISEAEHYQAQLLTGDEVGRQ